MPRPTLRARGLTLIEVLILVVIAAILVSMGISRLTGAHQGAEALKEDLRRVAETQREFEARHGRYARSLDELGLTASGGARIVVGGSGLESGRGFHAVATDSTGRTRCVLGVGVDTLVAGSAVSPGEIVCP